MKAGNFLHFFSLILISIQAYGSATVGSKELSKAVQTFIDQQAAEIQQKNDVGRVNISLRAIDSRLKLPQCVNALTFSPDQLPIKRNLSIKVNCEGNKPWSFYASATMSVEKPIVVAGSDLPKNHILTRNDLSIIYKNTFEMRSGYKSTVDELVGLQLKRAVRTHNVIYDHVLKSPDIIKKGERVTLIAKRGSLSVTSLGVALSDGSRGEKILIENARSARVVQGMIVGPGTVELL